MRASLNNRKLTTDTVLLTLNGHPEAQMKSRKKIVGVLLVPSLFAMSLSLVSCDGGQPKLASGVRVFKSIVQQSFSRLENGKIERNKGFDTECAVDFKTEHGIRVNETVCDQDNIRKVTIHITDPTSRPASQQLQKIELSTKSGGTISTGRGQSEVSRSGITIEFDRSGQSVVLDGQVGS